MDPTSYHPQNQPPERCPRCGAPANGLFCQICGEPLVQEFSSPAPAKKSRAPLVIFCIALACAILTMLGAIALRVSTRNRQVDQLEEATETLETVNPSGISREEFEKLKLGMSYAHISAIIGGDGVYVQSGEDVRGKTYYIYGWAGERNSASAVYITFTDDAASEFSVEGTL